MHEQRPSAKEGCEVCKLWCRRERAVCPRMLPFLDQHLAGDLIVQIQDGLGPCAHSNYIPRSIVGCCVEGRKRGTSMSIRLPRVQRSVAMRARGAVAAHLAWCSSATWNDFPSPCRYWPCCCFQQSPAPRAATAI